jgi:cyanophycinase-like exopeptidase
MTTIRARRFFYLLLILLSVFSLWMTRAASAQQEPTGHLIPIGGGYSDTYAGFSKEAIANAKNDQVNILVLPITMASNPDSIAETERADLLKAAEERRVQIEQACQSLAPKGVTCTATLAPILTHADAEQPAAWTYFSGDLSAIFILSGEPAIGMTVIDDTPVLTLLQRAYESGVILAGTGGGANLQSVAMLADYNVNYTADNSLNFGAVQLWNSSTEHGLPFGVKPAVLDTSFYLRNRLGRLLNTIALPNAPPIGIGMDAYTGVNLYGGTRLQDVFGLYTATILDGATYHAAEGVHYAGPDHVLSLRNVLVQMLAPGDFSYDLDQRTLSIGKRTQAPQDALTRDFKALALPRGAGPLILAGDLSTALDGNSILNQFVDLSGGDQAKIVIIAAGFPSASIARATANKYAAALNVPAETIVVDAENPSWSAADEVTGVVLIAKDQSLLDAELLQPIKTAWLSGKPLLTDDGGTAVVGRFYSAHGPTPQNSDEVETAVQKSFQRGITQLRPGLGLLDIMLEPQVLNDNRWGRLFSLAYNQPKYVAFGLTQNTAVEITVTGTKTLGDNAVVALDLRSAKLDAGTNDGFVIANGLLDVFAPGEDVVPGAADVKASPTRFATPALPTSTPTPSLTPTSTLLPTPTSTATPRPTSTQTPTPTPTLAPSSASTDTAASGHLLPFAIVAGVIFFVVVLVVGQRRK